MEERFIPERRKWPQKFGGAFRGCVSGIRGHDSFIVHLPAAFLALSASAYFGVAAWEWCVVIGCVTVVIAAEIFNSALESLAKAVTSNRNPHVAQALDIASAAVLLTALGAVACGLIVFVPRVLSLFA